jgi:hypothetical protein
MKEQEKNGRRNKGSEGERESVRGEGRKEGRERRMKIEKRKKEKGTNE